MRLFKFLPAGVLALVLAACGGNASEGTATADAATPAAAKTAVKTQKSPVIVLEAGQQLPVADGKLMVIDFNATWCGPCRKFAPHFDKVAEKYSSKAKFVRVDVDKLPQLAAMYGVQGIPTVIYISPDGTVDQSVGYMTEAEFDARVAGLLR